MPDLLYDYRTLAQIGWLPIPLAPAPVSVCSWHNQGVLAALDGGTGSIVTTLPAMSNAALNVGTYPGGPPLTLVEIRWRHHSLRAAVRTWGGWFRLKTIYATVDPSEKMALAYMLGGTFTALLANQVGLALPNFMHLTRFPGYPGSLNFNPAYGARRPDFISQLGGSFQIWEAKGRRNGGAPAPLRGAITQTQAIASVATAGGPLVPDANVAVLAKPAPGNFWRMHVCDPAGASEPLDDPRLQDAIYREYYRPWVELLESLGGLQADQYLGASFETVGLPGDDLIVGLERRTYAALAADRKSRRPPGELSAAIADAIPKPFDNPEDGGQFVNNNGLYTRLDEKTIGDDPAPDLDRMEPPLWDAR